jgi:hypothetical protein
MSSATGNINFNNNTFSNIKDIRMNTNSSVVSAFQLLSGSSLNHYVSLGLGRTSTDLDIGVAAIASQWSVFSAAGNIVMRHNNSVNAIL